MARAKKISNELSLLNEWSKRLGLQDWSIILKTNCDPDEIAIPDSLGCSSWQESTKTAMIQIINPDLIGELTRPFDFEQILIHELLHLKTTLLSSGGDEDTLNDRILHQLIDDISRAMVDIKKSERSKE